MNPRSPLESRYPTRKFITIFVIFFRLFILAGFLLSLMIDFSPCFFTSYLLFLAIVFNYIIIHVINLIKIQTKNILNQQSIRRKINYQTLHVIIKQIIYKLMLTQYSYCCILQQYSYIHINRKSDRISNIQKYLVYQHTYFLNNDCCTVEIGYQLRYLIIIKRKVMQNYNDEQFEAGQISYGKYIVLKSDGYGRPQFLLGPHWPMAVITLVITGFALIAFLIYIQSLGSLIWFIVLLVATLLYIYSFVRIILSNPGFAEPIKHLNNEVLSHPKYCNICVTHCDQCQICIDGFDHHCPWTGKCIGKNNTNSFYFFLGMLFSTLGIAMVALIATGINNDKTYMYTH